MIILHVSYCCGVKVGPKGSSFGNLAQNVMILRDGRTIKR